MSAIPGAIEYERAPCPKCGAVTLDEAENKCRPTQDQTGEWSCPGDEKDDGTHIMRPTQASLDRLDAWISDAMAKCQP